LHVQAQQSPTYLQVDPVERYVLVVPPASDQTKLQSAAGVYTVPGGVNVRDVVYLTGANTADVASNASEATGPAVAVVSSKPTGVTATLVYAGELGGFVGLTPGAVMYLGTAGAIIPVGSLPVAVGAVVQQVGAAIDANTMLFDFKQGITL
jgi:hypothetical protein